MKNDWEKKEKTCSAYISSKIFDTSARVWTRSTSLSSFQRSNWSPTYILHLFHLENTSLLFIFLSESVNVRFFHALTLSLLKLALKCQIFCLICKPNMFFPSFLNRFSYFMNLVMMPMIIFGRYYPIYVILHLARANYCQWIA
jgi:hypothetical protein